MAKTNKTQLRLTEQKLNKGKATVKYHSNASLSRKFESFNDLNLIAPAEYYRRAFPDISTNKEWAKVLCPFHNDTRPSLSINLEKGWFKCHSCGEKRGGIIKFHMTKWGLTWKQAITELEVA